MGDISGLDAQLPALTVGSIAYGIYLVTFFACLQKLLWQDGNWKRCRDINLTMMCIVLSLFVSSSLNLALTLVRNVQIWTQSYTQSTIDQLGQSWVNIIKPTTVSFQALLADSVLVYRCWLIWNKSFILILFPLISLLANAAFGVIVFYLQIVLVSGPRMKTGIIFWLVMAFWACTILVNVYCTTAIVWKICRTERSWSPPSILSIEDIPQRGRLQLAKRIIIESGLMYTVSSIILFISHVCRSNSAYITSSLEVQVTGIAFNLILTRVAEAKPRQLERLPQYRNDIPISSSQQDSSETTEMAMMGNTDPCGKT